MAHQFIVTMRDLRRVHPPDKEVLRGINISMYPGAKIGVLGLNGSGKSTLLRIIAGEDDGYSGEVPGHARLQRRLPAPGAAARPDQGRARQRHRRRRAHEGPARPLRRGVQRDGRARRRLRQAPRASSPSSRTRSTRSTAGISTASSRSRWTRCGSRRPTPTSRSSPAASAAGSRCAGCCSSKPDLLLLDEPTNHLDAESVAWLERHLHEYHGTVVAVTHDRYFLDNVAGWILELDRGYGIPWEGNYSSWLEQKDERLAQEEKVDETRRRTLARELEWIRMAPRARQAKGKARINAFEKLVAEAESAERREAKLQISIPPGPRLGDLVVEAEHLRKGYGDRLLIDDLSFTLPRGGIVGVIGAERRGQDHAVPHARRPGAARRRRARRSVRPSQFAYVDQSRESLDADKTVYEEITGGVDHLKVGDREVHGRAYVAGFNFKGSDQQKRVGDLSGGERNRLHLAKALLMGAQRVAARRADQRPRRRHAARARRGAARVPGLRGRDQSRSLVPRPHRDARARVRGRQRGARGSRATSPTTRTIGTSASAPTPISRTASKYKPLTR